MPFSTIIRRTPAFMDKELRSLVAKMLGNSRAENNALLAKLEELDPKKQQQVFEELTHQQRAAGLQESNLLTAKVAGTKLFGEPVDPSAELLLAPLENNREKAAASMIYRPGEHEGTKGILPGSVYIEGLASQVPGGGTAMLKELEKSYPGHAFHLESMSYPETLQFYTKKGFVEVPRNSRGENLLGGEAPFFVKPPDVQIKKAGGTVKTVSELRNAVAKFKDGGSALFDEGRQTYETGDEPMMSRFPQREEPFTSASTEQLAEARARARRSQMQADTAAQLANFPIIRRKGREGVPSLTTADIEDYVRQHRAPTPPSALQREIGAKNKAAFKQEADPVYGLAQTAAMPALAVDAVEMLTDPSAPNRFEQVSKGLAGLAGRKIEELDSDNRSSGTLAGLLNPANLVDLGVLAKGARLAKHLVKPAALGVGSAAYAGDSEAAPLEMLLKASKYGYMPKPYYRVHPNGGVHLKPEWANEEAAKLVEPSIEPVVRSIDHNSTVPEMNYFAAKKNFKSKGGPVRMAEGGVLRSLARDVTANPNNAARGKVSQNKIATVQQLQGIISRIKQGSAHA